MTRVIEINDVALRLADAHAVLATSPGYAVVDAKRLVVGAEAEAQARLDPRHTTNQFWHRLSMDPVQHPHPAARSLADLAHAHLLELWEAAEPVGSGDGEADVIFTLPGILERDQIALLLGIARECPFRPVGLVDSAVAATAAACPEASAVVHVDALLHEAVVTLVERNDGHWERGRVQDVPSLGFAALREAWINVIADTFVRETRFDPLHDARTEQSLFDRLDAWLTALTDRAEIEIELQTAAQVHRVALPRARLVDKIAPRLAPLVDAVAAMLPEDGQVLLSPRFGRLPGMTEALTERLGRAPRVIADDAPLRGALEHEAEIRHDGEALRFVTSLPCAETAPAAEAAAPARPAPPDPAAAAATDAAPVTAPSAGAAPASSNASAVTHVLLGHRAWPLRGDRVDLGGEDGLDPDRFPLRLGTLEQHSDGWHLVAAAGGPELPALAPGEARVLGPAHTLVTLIRVEQD